MTKLREPRSIENTLRVVLGTIGLERAAELTGRERGYLHSLTDPDSRYHLTFRDAQVLDLEFIAIDGTTPIFDTYAQLLDDERAKRFAIQHQLAQLTAAAVKEGGEAIAALIEAQMPDADAEDKRNAAKQLEEAIVAFKKCSPIIQGMMASQPAAPP